MTKAVKRIFLTYEYVYATDCVIIIENLATAKRDFLSSGQIHVKFGNFYPTHALHKFFSRVSMDDAEHNNDRRSILEWWVFCHTYYIHILGSDLPLRNKIRFNGVNWRCSINVIRGIVSIQTAATNVGIHLRGNLRASPCPPPLQFKRRRFQVI